MCSDCVSMSLMLSQSLSRSCSVSPATRSPAAAAASPVAATSSPPSSPPVVVAQTRMSPCAVRLDPSQSLYLSSSVFLNLCHSSYFFLNLCHSSYVSQRLSLASSSSHPLSLILCLDLTGLRRACARGNPACTRAVDVYDVHWNV